MALTLETRQNNKNTAGTSVSAVSGNNNGGLLGGSVYLNEKMALGFLSSVEGIWDYTAGGIAKLFGADKWAERRFVNDWVNYNHADEWYDPGKGWQIAGDVAGGIGTSLPAIVGAGVAAKLTLATGGAAAPAAIKLLSVSVAPLMAGLGAAGNATKSAYQKTGELGLKEFGYGAISGATEAGIEGLTARIGTGTGRIVSSLSKRAAGETVSTLGKSGAFALLKTLGADFASEAVEEGLAEALDPFYQRWTSVDPNAQNASAKEIGYAALVGGISGIVMSGGAAAFNTTANLFGGERSVSNGTSGDIINTARRIAEYESANDTGYKSFQAIRDAYSQLSPSLSSTGGQVSTVRQKMLLGSLKQAETAAFVEPFIERSAMSLLTSSESAAERFSALGMTDENGRPLTFTAEQIRSGVDAGLITKFSEGKLTDTERRTLTKQVRKAIGTNSVLTTLAVMDATGRISMDAEKFAQAALSGRQIATAADLNRFIETASPAQIENLSKKLKIDNWAALTPDVFQSRVAEFNATEEGQAYRAQMEFVKQAQTIADSESKKLPRLFRSNTVAQGLTHYASADGRVNMALLREGDRYHLYDYETGNPSRDLTLAEVNSAIRPYWNAQGNAQSTAQTAQDAQKPMEVQTEGVSTETTTESATAAQAVRLNMIASENISDWKQLSEPNRAAVRMTMRQAIAAGMDEDTALTFGRVAARSGMNIVFSAEQSGDGDARITGNTIYIDPNADKGRMENKLLLHEAGHALMRERDGARLIARAFETVEPDRSSQIAQKYQKFYQQLGMRMDQYLPIIDEEIAAAGIEDTLSNINAWEYILSEEPSFGEKLLNFFRGAARDYSANEGLSSEARKLLLSYRKMFNELSKRNRGNNAVELAREDNKKTVTRMNEENMQVTDMRFAMPEDISEDEKNSGIAVAEFIESVNNMREEAKRSKRKKKIGIISKGHVAIIDKLMQTVIPDFSASGYELWIDGTGAHHIEVRHGKNGEADHTMASKEAKALIPWAAQNADSSEFIRNENGTIKKSDRYFNSDGSRAPEIKLKKITPQGVIFISECVPDSHKKRIWITSAYANKNGSKGQLLNLNPKDSSNLTPEASFDGNATNDRIAQNQPKVNSKSKKSSDERLALPEDSKYLDAVNRGDMETAQKMVDEAAKKAGYDTDAYHGTNQGSFTVFDWSKTQRADGGFYGRGHYFTKSENMAKMYGERIIRGKLKLGKTFVWSEQVNSYEGKKTPELLSRNVVSRINLAKIFPDIFANQKMHYWEYDATKGESVEKTIKWGDLEGIVKGLSNGLVLRAYADGTYRWHTEGRFWEVPVGESFSSVEEAEGGKFFAAINALPEKYDGLLQNMSFDDQTTYTQQYGTEITEALKKSGYESAMDTPEGGEIVVFGSSQIKSADPVTYDDNGNVIPLSERFNANNSDIRYALPEDGKKKKKYHMSHGQLRADVANKTRKKAYSKADARATLEGFTGADLLTKKAQNELADYMWQGFNTCETKEQRETFAKNFAQELGKKLFLVQDEAPDAAMYRERLTYLRSGIGKLAITSGDYAGDFRHVLDKDGYASFRARWSFGAKAGKQGFRPYSVDKFVNDIADEMPGMAYLKEMTPADAMLEIDRLYTEAKAGAKEKVDVYTEEEANAVIGGFEAQILKAFDERGHLSVFQKRVGYLLEQYTQMAEDAQAKYDEVVGRDKILGRIDSLAQKMKDLKMGTFANATQMDSDVFVGSIHKLASIEYRRNLSVTKTKSALRELSAWYTQEQKPLMYVDEQNPGYYNKGVAEMLRALTETDDPFTKDQLAMLQDVMSYFVKFVENYGKVWRGGKWIDAKPEAERYVAQIVKNADIKTTTFDRMMRTRYINSFGDPHAVVKQYDGYDDGFCTEMFEEIRKAALDADVQLMNVMSDYDAFMKKNPKYMKQAAKQQIRWVEDGRTNTMPKMVAIGLYMTSKREHAQAGLALNGFKFKDADGNIIRAGAIIRNADPKEVTQAQIGEAITDLQSRIRKQLSAEDLEYIKILEKGYGYDLRALKAERDMARQGFTNVTMGYYYPIRRADIAKSIDTSVFSELDRVSNASFNKSIVEGARGKLFIEDADALFHRHAVAVTRYSSLSPVIESFNILFNMDTSGNPNNSVSVATTIEAQWPKAKEYFRDLIADVQGVAKNLGEYSDTLATLRSYVAMSQLGANPKTWVTQFSSLFAASSMLDPASIRKGLAHVSDDVDNYCDLAKLRNYEGAAIKAQGVLDKVSSVGELLMKPIAATDRLVVKCLWGACQVQVQKDSKLKIGTEENKVAAGKMLTEVLFETQQNSLATERSAMMRSGNELIRALTMFSADGMKVTGRFLDGIGEVSVLKRRLETANADEKPAIEKKLKAAKKRSRKATAAMVSSAVFAVMIAEAFRWLYAKEREEDENAWADMSADFVGNLLGGLPGLRDVYSFFIDGYELDNYAISAVNDLLTSVKSTTTLAWDLVRGEGDPKDIPAKVKNLAYAAGQFTGIPVRNIYNVLTGLTRRVSPNAGYLIDNVFYQKNYRTDLKKAIENGDMRRVSLLMGLINGKDASGLIGDEGMSELNRLALAGASVLPRTIGKTVSINGEEVDLDTSQVQMINEAYNESWSASLASLLASPAYASMNDAQKEKAIRMVHDISYERSLVSAGIDRGEKSVLIADLIGIESAAVYYSLTSGIVSDVDKNGKTVEGSKRAKVVSAIRSMNLGRERTLLMICLAGYSLKDGDVRGMKAKSEKVLLLKYIMQLPGKSAAQKAVIAQACGFEVRNGRVLMSSLNGD